MAPYKMKFGFKALRKAPYPHLYENQNGGFVARGRATDPAGRQRMIVRSYPDANDPLEALRLFEEELHHIETGLPRQANVLFSEFATSLLERKILRRELRSKASHHRWANTLTRLISGHEQNGLCIHGLGDFPVTELRTAHIEAWKDEVAGMINAGIFAPTTTNGWIGCLKVVSKAISREFECRDFMANITMFNLSEHVTYSEEQPNSIKPKDISRFLSTLKEYYPQYWAMALLGFLTGLRPCTLRPIRRRGSEPDILWDESRLLVRRSETYGHVMKTTKTAIRYSIHLPNEIMEALRWHVDTQLSDEQRCSDLLFPSVTGGFRSPTVLNKPFADVVRRLGLPYKVTQRGMRRTFQDLARAAQVQDIITRSISGHSTEKMQQYYSSVSGSEQRASLSRVFNVIQGGLSDTG